MEYWIKFDLEKVKELKQIYENAMLAIKEALPNVKLNSRKEIINFFQDNLNIPLQTNRIRDIEGYLQRYRDSDPEYEIILGIVYYYKLHYSIKNYLDCIIKNNVNGVVELRDWFGPCMPNRQPLMASPEIQATIIEHSGNITLP